MEIWKDVMGFEGFYQISNCGRLRRSGNFVTASKPEKVLKPVIANDGYVRYRLSANSRQKSINAHQLVAEAFLGERPTDRHIVAHNDGNKQNNNLDNLRWATPAENAFDRVIHGTNKGKNYGRKRVLSDDEVYAIRADARPNYVLAEQYNVSRSCIHHIRKRLSYKHLPPREGDFQTGEDSRVFFSDEDIRKIRQDKRSSYVIAKELGVSANTIQRIWNRETYKSVPDDVTGVSPQQKKQTKKGRPAINFIDVDEKTMKIIFRNGMECIFDADDFDRLKTYRWRYVSNREGGYAGAEIYGETTKRIFMHRFIVNCPDGYVVDHINGNRLDNRKSNLRIVTRRQNGKNRGINSNNTSGYKGVTFDSRSNKYRASIMSDYKIIHLGTFQTAEEAAEAYAEASRKYHGEYGRTLLDD